MRILIPAPIQRRRRAFAALFSHASAAGLKMHVERSRAGWWERRGDYRSLAGKLAPHLDALRRLDVDGLAAEEHYGVNLFAIARAELLTVLLPRWRDGAGPNEDASVLRRAWETERPDLLLCMAAARSWIGFWKGVLHEHGPFAAALVGSAVHMHDRALRAVGQAAGLRLFSVEAAPLGDGFLFEERAIPGALPDDPDLRGRIRAEAHRRLAGAPGEASVLVRPPFRDKGAGTVLVIGQAQDDAAVIGAPGLPEVSVAAMMRTLVAAILDRTACTVAFKGPAGWTGPVADAARLAVVETAPLDGLLPYADWAVGLSAPGLVAAARAGLKPAQAGRAAFGGRGFTHDYADVETLVGDLAAGRLAPRLDIQEYRALEDYLARELVLRLVPNTAEGARKIAARLADPRHVPNVAEADLLLPPRRSPLSQLRRGLANPTALLRLLGARLTR